MYQILRHLSVINGYRTNPFNHCYRDVSIEFNLPTIESTMKINDVKILLKICSGRINCPDLKESLPLNTRSIDHRFNPPFYLEFNTRKYLDHEPIYRLSKCGNELVGKNR